MLECVGTMRYVQIGYSKQPRYGPREQDANRGAVRRGQASSSNRSRATPTGSTNARAASSTSPRTASSRSKTSTTRRTEPSEQTRPSNAKSRRARARADPALPKSLPPRPRLRRFLQILLQISQQQPLRASLSGRREEGPGGDAPRAGPPGELIMANRIRFASNHLFMLRSCSQIGVP